MYNVHTMFLCFLFWIFWWTALILINCLLTVLWLRILKGSSKSFCYEASSLIKVDHNYQRSNFQELWNNAWAHNQSPILLPLKLFKNTSVHVPSHVFLSLSVSHIHTDAGSWFLSAIKLLFSTKLILSNSELPVVNPLWCAATELWLCVCVYTHAFLSVYEEGTFYNGS